MAFRGLSVIAVVACLPVGTAFAGSPPGGGGGQPATYPAIYVSSSTGDDANSGRSVNEPIRSIAKLNTMLVSIGRGGFVYLKRGDTFRDDYIRLINNTGNGGGSSAGPTGTATQPIVITAYGSGASPILEEADAIRCTDGWTHNPTYPNVYDCITAKEPGKLYLDMAGNAATEPLVFVPNGSPVAWVNGHHYEFGDSVTNSGSTWIAGTPGGNTNSDGTGPQGHPDLWTTVNPLGGANFQQQFQVNNNGIQNVAAIGGGSVSVGIEFAGAGFPPSSSVAFTASCGTNGNLAGSFTTSSGGSINGFRLSANSGCTTVPSFAISNNSGSGYVLTGRLDKGSWYAKTNADGTYTLYVHTQDNSSPASHRVYGSFRPYGVLLQDVNYVSVSNLQIAHPQMAGILNQAYGAAVKGAHNGEYVTINNINIFNAGGLTTDATPFETFPDTPIERVNMGGGIVIAESNTHGATTTHLLRGVSIGNVTCNRVDDYYGEKQTAIGCVEVSGVDGGGGANNFILSQSYLNSVNATGLNIGTANHTHWQNNGGRFAYNEITNNANGNVFFAGTHGGKLDHNWIHDSFGEGIQSGWDDQGNVYAFNLITNLANTASQVGYNGSDCNAGNAGSYWLNNTIVNTFAAGMTFEGLSTTDIVHTDCPSSHVHNNYISQNANRFVGPYSRSTVLNPSSLIYFTTPSHTPDVDWSNNVYNARKGASRYFNNFHAAEYYDCNGATQAWFLGWPDKASSCTDAPGFANPSGLMEQQVDFSLSSWSPLRRAGTNGSDVGALAFGETSVFDGRLIGADPNDSATQSQQ